MKTRIFKVVNFFALNLLFFAVYLNFFSSNSQQDPAISTPPATAPGVKGTVLVENPKHYLQKQSLQKTKEQPELALAGVAL